jgi:starch synthase
MQVMVRCLFVTPELEGFAGTGGLADVAAALPRALADRGLDCAVIMPLYRALHEGPAPLRDTGLSFRVPLGTRSLEGRLWQSALPGSNVPVYLVAQADLFDRYDPGQGRGLYQYTNNSGQAVDYSDNSSRFAFFCRAVLEALPVLDFWPEVVHVNDWQTALVPVYLKEVYRQHPHSALRGHYEQIRSLLTIHNLAYQGSFWHYDMPLLGLPWRLFHHEKLEFYGKISFLKGGLVHADFLTTVSPTYAREIQTPYFGCGLQGVLMQRAGRLRGIVNGVDDRLWDPAHDPHLAAHYDTRTVAEGKAACKAALQAELGLPCEPRVPLLGMVTRLAWQKGFDLVDATATALLREQGVQFVVLGQGEKRYCDALTRLQQQFPGQARTICTWNEPLAHRIYAGADAFVMPSQYEPCGLGQLYSLRYGTIPVVRATGGLADTVSDATGFTFLPFTAEAFRGALDRCLAVYRDEPGRWGELRQTGMNQDWSWGRSAAEYEALYSQLLREI